ncbi:MAG: hypothetical protein H6Q74_931 [Firmicutes bacterium]|nr:hypothetical protein [Bacillota bacterium]
MDTVKFAAPPFTGLSKYIEDYRNFINSPTHTITVFKPVGASVFSDPIPFTFGGMLQTMQVILKPYGTDHGRLIDIKT